MLRQAFAVEAEPAPPVRARGRAPARAGAARRTCAAGSPRSWGRTPCARTGSRASRTRSARATRTSSGSAPATRRARPTRSSTRARHDEVLAVLELCAARARGRHAVRRRLERGRAASSRCRDGFAAAISLDLARMDRLVEADPRLAAPPRSSPAAPARRSRSCSPPRGSRSATSRSRGSTRRSAASWPRARPAAPRRATGGSTSSCSGVRLATPAGTLDLPPLPGQRRRARPARPRRRLRGHPRRDHAGDARRAADARRRS